MVTNSVPKTRQFASEAEFNKAVLTEKSLAFVDVPSSWYHATDAVNFSALKRMEDSASKYKWEIDNGERRQSKAMELGTAIHCALLEPDKFTKSYAMMPKFDGRTKEGKAGKAEWELANPNKTPLVEDDWARVERVRNTVMTDMNFKQLFEEGHKEHSFFVVDRETGLRLRCRPDNFVVNRGVIVDLKTTEDASVFSFSRDITNYRYFVQAAYYMDIVEQIMGERPKAFAILAVEKSRDCDMRLFNVAEDALAVGRTMYRQWLRDLRAAIETNEYRGYPREVVNYCVPEYLIESVKKMKGEKEHGQ